MLCLVQNFQQSRDKPPRTRRLPFMKRKKISPVTDRLDENLLHPNIAQESSGALWRQDKLKQLSGSAPSMTFSPLDLTLTPSTCRSRQKKFLRHFKVDPDEKVIDYYSCALVADILLQGHLYISKNYFAFYSNVFGYVTKLLIPTISVTNVTKEKTAFILPNAVGVTTADDRHVFSSLLSRDTTYKLMVQVWLAAQSSRSSETATPELEGDNLCEETSSLSGSESVLDIKASANRVPTIPEVEVKEAAPQSGECVATSESRLPLPKSTLLLTVATMLLIILFLSATVLIYRVSLLQHSISTQTPKGSRPLHDVKAFLDTNLNNLCQVRQTLEELSILMESEKENSALRISENYEDNSKTIDTIQTADLLTQQTEDLTAS